MILNLHRNEHRDTISLDVRQFTHKHTHSRVEVDESFDLIMNFNILYFALLVSFAKIAFDKSQRRHLSTVRYVRTQHGISSSS